MNWLFPALQTGAGIMGLFGAGRQNRDAQAAAREAARLAKIRAGLMEDSAALARGYDPASEDQAALNHAAQMTAEQLREGLAGFRNAFAQSGGTPGFDTRYLQGVQGVTDRAGDPLRAMAAQLGSTRTQRKLGALGAAMGQGGDLASTFMGLAEQQRADPGPSIQLISGGLNQLLGPRPNQGARSQSVNGQGVPDLSFLTPARRSPADYAMEARARQAGRKAEKTGLVR